MTLMMLLYQKGRIMAHNCKYDCIAYPVCSPNIEKDGPECRKFQYSLKKEKRGRTITFEVGGIVGSGETAKRLEEMREKLEGEREKTMSEEDEVLKTPQFDGVCGPLKLVDESEVDDFKKSAIFHCLLEMAKRRPI